MHNVPVNWFERPVVFSTADPSLNEARSHWKIIYNPSKAMFESTMQPSEQEKFDEMSAKFHINILTNA